MSPPFTYTVRERGRRGQEEVDQEKTRTRRRVSGEEAAGRRGRRPRHALGDVVAAAVAVADDEGLGAVSMRSVAARLGTGAMSLYNYVPDKEALVAAMVEH